MAAGLPCVRRRPFLREAVGSRRGWPAGVPPGPPPGCWSRRAEGGGRGEGRRPPGAAGAQPL